MSPRARCGSLILLLSILAGLPPALAQEQTQGQTAGDRTPAAGTWTDPPARGLASPATPPAKPAETSSAVEKKSRAIAGRKETGKVAAVGSARRTAKVHRRSVTREAHAPAPRRRLASSSHAAMHADTRRAGRMRLASRERYHARQRPLYDETQGFVDGYGPRRAGWGDLLVDDRAARIAEARRSGFLIMRMRTEEYPDGRSFRSFHPIDEDDLD